MPHLINIQNLTKQEIMSILTKASEYLYIDNKTKKINYNHTKELDNKTVYNLFYEPSTRTRVSFELAAKNLGGRVINIDVALSSVKKGESLKDTVLTLKAMHSDVIIIRHSEDETAAFIADICNDYPTIINAGNGVTTHPTQALLDLFTILKHKPNIEDIQVSIVGDILHSRVASSLITALKKLNCKKIHVIGPEILLPESKLHFGENVSIYDNLKDGLQDSDVIVCLRLQKERMMHTLILNEEEYLHTYGITSKSIKYAKPDAIVMHPGPINRNIEISSEIADGKQSVILEQVTYGVAIRMAILALYA